MRKQTQSYQSLALRTGMTEYYTVVCLSSHFPGQVYGTG